ncbi:MAG: acyl-CoA-binding protein [Proteobacteria bacterium]|nr:acyl-CoA-binding protein [Pseudomonadota bacterium]
MAELAERFAAAQVRVKPVTGLGNDTQLELYALFKQATSGDCTGARPGMMDLKGRAKYDAWAKKKGMTAEVAMDHYCHLASKVAP